MIIGKIGTPDNILNKPGPLTKDEFEIMKQHPGEGWYILKSLKTFHNIAEIVKHHHEKLDGSGYPFGLTSKELGLEERIVSCLDFYQALVEDRPYRNSMHHKQAIEILRKNLSNFDLDIEIINAIDKVFE